MLLVGGVLLIARPGANGVGGSPPSAAPSSPLASPAGSADTALTATFTSTRYGFSVRHPSAWAETPAIQSWPAGQKNNWGSGFNDEISGTTARFSGAGQVLAQGQTADEWLAAYGAAFGSSGAPATWPTVMIDGVEGRIDFDGVSAGAGSITAGGVAFDAVVVSGPYAFNFNMDGNVDRATFEAILATVTLPSAPALDATLTSTMNGFSVRYARAWTTTPATKVWPVDDYNNYDPALSDVFGNDKRFMGGSTLMAPGETFEHWFAQYDAFRVATNCSNPSLEEPVTVDGLPGLLDRHCPTAYLEVVVAKGNRVYVFTTWQPDSLLFSSMLDTVKLTPSTATP